MNLLPILAKVLVFVLLAYTLWVLAGCALQRRVIFPRHVIPTAEEQAEAVEGLEVVHIDTPEGRVEAWVIPGEGVSAEEPGPAVLFAHGNAELIDYLPEQVEPYTRLGVTVMLGEYRGYGRSAGSPTQRKITDDFIAFHDLLAGRAEVDGDRIVLHGRSIGAAVACAVGVERRPAGLILQSPFTSIADMAGWMLPGFAILDRFDSAAMVEAYDGPVLILHGRHDSIIPVSHGRRLNELAPRSTLVEYDAGHNDFPFDSPRHWDDLERFLREHGVLRE